MKVYVDSNDIGTTVTYKEENGKRQYLYVHDKEGFVFKDLADYTKQVRKEVCDGLALPLIKHFQKDAEFTVEEICKWIEEYKNQIQGETK